MCAFKDQQAQGIVMDVIDIVAQKKGVRQTFEELLSEETYDKYINSMRVPDWVLVYFKIKARISDSTCTADSYQLHQPWEDRGKPL